MDSKTILKQLAAKMTSFGFPSEPFQAEVATVASVTPTLFVVRADGLVDGGPVYALVVRKGHIPVPVEHVVDFRIGTDIYS